MGSNRPMKRGEIWLVNLDPTLGHEINKIRPAIILQNDYANRFSNTTVVAPVTTKKIEKVYPDEILLTKENSMLKNISKALFNQIRCIDKRRLVTKRGFLSNGATKDMDRSIKISLGLM